MRTLSLLLAVLCGAASAARAQRVLVVAREGGGQFTRVQAAIDSVPENNRERTLILIRPGVYKERITVPKTKPLLTLRGQSPERTILSFDNYANKLGPDGKPLGTFNSASVFVFADDFVAENLTFENTAFPRKAVGQALAMNVTGDRAAFRRCRFLGWQDTLYAGGAENRQYFADCAIEGDVDFIFGESAAVFERCRIHSKGRGYVTAHARLAADVPTGYVFRDCTLTGLAGEPASVYLGRPWRPYSRVVFINCWMGAHIRPEGWNNWGKAENERTAWYGERNSAGPGADPRVRVPWSRQLSSDEIAPFETRRFLAGSDDWNPTP